MFLFPVTQFNDPSNNRNGAGKPSHTTFPEARKYSLINSGTGLTKKISLVAKVCQPLSAKKMDLSAVHVHPLGDELEASLSLLRDKINF